eukprot:1307954-Rhodomonas_salina.1
MACAVSNSHSVLLGTRPTNNELFLRSERPPSCDARGVWAFHSISHVWSGGLLSCRARAVRRVAVPAAASAAAQRAQSKQDSAVLGLTC